MTSDEAEQYAQRLRARATEKMREARRLLHGHRRLALIAWARQIEAEADALEANWFRNGAVVR